MELMTEAVDPLERLLNIERHFDMHETAEWTGNNWWIAILAVILYVSFIFQVGPNMMEGRKGFELTILLVLWNLMLASFSFFGAYRAGTYLVSALVKTTYRDTICTNPYESWGSNGPVAFWTMCMCYSKVVELGDTVFIILRKKPLLFLHWYHHITVLLFCWLAYSIPTGSGIYFVAMNYSVHAIMYFYYAMKAIHLVPKSFPAALITQMQSIQMMIGIIVCLSGWYYRIIGQQCDNDIKIMIAGATMYSSYLLLFLQFAYDKYVKKGK